jgi:hypothetical protein
MSQEQGAAENALERALRLAAAEAASRPDFYRVLLESEVYVIGNKPQGAADSNTVAAGEKLSIQNWAKDDGTPIVPFFSSLAQLRRALTEEASYLALPARSLFEITKGASLVLNPNADYGKEFVPQEVEALLSGGMTQEPVQRVTQKEAKVLLGQPAKYPTRIVEALKALFAKRDEVSAAYLCLMHDTAQDEKAHLVVGVEVDGELEPLLREAGTIAADAAPEDEAVDLFRVVAGDEGLSAYFLKSVKAFYRRAEH